MLSVSGVADAVHIAVYYIGTILLEYQDRNPGSVTGSYRQAGARGGPPAPGHYGGDRGDRGPREGGGGQSTAQMPGAQTQQIFIPNGLVGASEFPFWRIRPTTNRPVIGKGGQKINEIRQQSQCQIRVTDPGTPATPGGPVNQDERLVTITGLPHNINIAVQMLYARLEQEKQKAL